MRQKECTKSKVKIILFIIPDKTLLPNGIKRKKRAKITAIYYNCNLANVVFVILMLPED